MENKVDTSIQKYLSGEATQEDKAYLLDSLLKGYNEILITLHLLRLNNLNIKKVP